MSRTRIRWIAGFATLAIVVIVLLVVGQGESGPETTPKPRPVENPVAMPTGLIGLEITLGIKDEKATVWDGELQISEGKLLELSVGPAPVKGKVDGSQFIVSSAIRKVQGQPVTDSPVIRASLDAPLKTTVTIKTKEGVLQFPLSSLVVSTPKAFLKGRATVERQDGSVRLTGSPLEDDYPALARASDGTIWLAYVEYQPGTPIIMDRVKAGGFETLETKGHGDRVRLKRYDGKSWQPGLDVTEGGLDVWRPSVAVDGKGNVVVAWSQQVDNDWEIYYRKLDPNAEGGKWSDIVRLTRSSGADFNVVAATDSAGTVWLAWQGWRDGNFDILAAALVEGHSWAEPKAISASKANDWNPAIATDSKGNVFIAWDTYDKGNYDVRMVTIAKDQKDVPKPIDVAASARYEARPSLACDGKDRVWIAYEEGDEQWGKDYAHKDFRKIGFDKNAGSALYINRTVKVKCLADGKLMAPSASIEDGFAGLLRKNKSMPRLAVDGSGGVWLLLRRHPLHSGVGEAWNSFALRYDGKRWSSPSRLIHSSNILDNRPALVPHGMGILAVHSSDGRTRSLTRADNDLFATFLTDSGKVQAPELAADAGPVKAERQTVHAREAEDIARVRGYEMEVGDKKLKLKRGEFHRHTEYTAHGDQDGLLEDAWRYALDAGDLDWIGIGDHDNGYDEYSWWRFQKITDVFHNPPRFVAEHTYERSVPFPNGHRNVLMPRRGIRPLPRGDLEGTAFKGTPDTKTLYAYLKHFGGICASHTSATTMGTDWRDNSPDYEPIVEIYQGHRHNYEHFGAPRSATKETQIDGYRSAGFIWNALEKGYRFGFQASSDHVSTHISYAIVLTDDFSRQGIIDAFKKRHCYAATDNIIMDVRSGQNVMGDAFTTNDRPALEVHVHGTAPIARLHVIRDNKYVYSTEPKKQEVKLTWKDADAKKDKTSYYYIRIEQEDGNLAWASAMWITWKP